MDVLDPKYFKKGCKNGHHWFIKEKGEWVCQFCNEPPEA